MDASYGINLTLDKILGYSMVLIFPVLFKNSFLCECLSKEGLEYVLFDANRKGTQTFEGYRATCWLISLYLKRAVQH